MKEIFTLIAVAIACTGCGDNLAGPGTHSLSPPGSLAAFSADSTHVHLSWTPPAVASDTTFRGYVVSWGITSDTIPAASSFIAGPLVHTAIPFVIRSILKDGQVSSSVTITWAGAWRFDSPITLTEYYPTIQTGAPGMSAGTSTTDPRVVQMLDPDAGTTLDFYLYGLAGAPLNLVSAAGYDRGWHQTVFSTTTTSSPDLNAPLAAFPPDNTFTQPTAIVAGNTIYYAKIPGNSGQIYYVRIH
ncbi:MAG TPA: fibronectin type III domain-containing protein, partial [Bacteroidota bacterium]|nr:fibronectin type III domain-containing protein [Bacteroidota bacterium]